MAAAALRALRQKEMGEQLAVPLEDDEVECLDASCGGVQLADSGEQQGREAGFARPVGVVTAQVVLDQRPSVAQVVPLTSTIRGYRAEVTIEPDPGTGLEVLSAAQCQHIRAIAVERLAAPAGNIGPEALSQIREVLADLLDL